jgi:dynein heavy chain
MLTKLNTSNSLKPMLRSSIAREYLKDRFEQSVQDVGPKLTDLTLAVYQSLLVALPPTPAKFHYVFNLRDLGRIFEGLCLATPDYYSEPQSLVRLWRCEVTRVLFDRLTSTDDCDLVNNILVDALRGKNGCVGLWS